MSETLTPKELAMAAAQGVAIALNARRAAAAKEEFFHRPIIICGIPQEIYEVPLELDEGGLVTPAGGGIRPAQVG